MRIKSVQARQRARQRAVEDQHKSQFLSTSRQWARVRAEIAAAVYDASGARTLHLWQTDTRTASTAHYFRERRSRHAVVVAKERDADQRRAVHAERMEREQRARAKCERKAQALASRPEFIERARARAEARTAKAQRAAKSRLARLARGGAVQDNQTNEARTLAWLGFSLPFIRYDTSSSPSRTMN
jgi:hypothetical protein